MIVGIYHKDCIDGTTAAAVLLKKFPDAKVFPLRHRYEPEDFAPVREAAAEAEHIYTVDCGIGAPELVGDGYSVTTIDHHAGARELFENLAKDHSNYTYVFDNEKSGASLSWDYLFPHESVPEIIRLVEDQDLWNWKFGEKTRDVNNYVSLFLNKPEEIVPLLGTLPAEVTQEGALITRFTNRLINHYVEKVRPIRLRIGEHVIPAYNIIDFQSECGHILSKRHNAAVVLFTIRGASVNMSFRGNDHDIPTSLDLATMLGGGGHKNSAGTDVLLEIFTQMMMKEGA